MSSGLRSADLASGISPSDFHQSSISTGSERVGCKSCSSPAPRPYAILVGGRCCPRPGFNKSATGLLIGTSCPCGYIPIVHTGLCAHLAVLPSLHQTFNSSRLPGGPRRRCGCPQSPNFQPPASEMTPPVRLRSWPPVEMHVEAVAQALCLLFGLLHRFCSLGSRKSCSARLPASRTGVQVGVACSTGSQCMWSSFGRHGSLDALTRDTLSEQNFSSQGDRNKPPR